jgi:hypothetical protein
MHCYRREAGIGERERGGGGGEYETLRHGCTYILIIGGRHWYRRETGILVWEGDAEYVQCTVYSVQCTVCSVQCTVYSVQCTIYSVQCTM